MAQEYKQSSIFIMVLIFTISAGTLMANEKNMRTQIFKKKYGKWQATLKPGATLEEKLKSIKIPTIDFENARPDTVFDYLAKLSKTLDPEKKGVNIIHMGLHKYKPCITFNANDIPLYEVIKYVCMLSNLTFQVDRYAVVIKPNKTKKRKK